MRSTSAVVRRNRIRSIALLLSLLLGAHRPSFAASAGVLALQDAFADVAEKAKLAVVNISVVQEQKVPAQNFLFGDPEDFFQQFMQGPAPRYYKFRSEGTGSGFIIDPKGYCVTNDHVVRGATDIRVTLTTASGREKTYPGKIVGHDPNLDLAVVKIQSNETFSHLTLSDKLPRVGDWAIAVGSPFALEHTVTAGIISAQRQSLYIEGRRYPNLIQTDAAINRGNSGGPLLNIEGDVVGVNTAIYSPNGGSAGIGFAIPASEVKMALGYLMAGKRLHPGWLGIETQPIDEIIQRRLGLPTPDGALVNSVFPGSPAEKAGLKRGDVIQQLNDKKIVSPEELVGATSLIEAGKKISLTVFRAGSMVSLTASLGERPEWADQQRARRPQTAQAPEDEPPQENSASLKWEGAEFSQSDAGAAVVQVSPNSPLAGSLIPGDVLRGINNTAINRLDDLRQAAKKIKISEGLFLDIVRQGQPLYISVKP